jgi:hypothetical protein
MSSLVLAKPTRTFVFLPEGRRDSEGSNSSLYF